MKKILPLLVVCLLLTNPLIADIRAYFSPGISQRAILPAIQHATKSIQLCIYQLTDPDLATALKAAIGRGVSVRIIADAKEAKDKYSKVLTFSPAIVHLDANHSIQHNKYCIIDERVLLTGSFNWSKAANTTNAENLILTDDKLVISQYLDDFKRHLIH